MNEWVLEMCLWAGKCSSVTIHLQLLLGFATGFATCYLYKTVRELQKSL